MKRIIVIGGGVTGLVLSWRLARGGADVTLIDAGRDPGGWIASERVDGFVLEKGPLAWRGPGAEGAALIGDLGLGDDLVTAAAEAKARYFALDRQLVAAPMSPVAFARSRLLTASGKWRLFAEPRVKTPAPTDDESVAAFATRRFGPEVARLVDPMVSGVFAGDAARLSVRSAFPSLARWEADGGSVFRGAIRASRAASRARRKNGTPRMKTRLLTFRDGLGEVTARLARELGARMSTGARVIGIERAPGRAVGRDGGWRVHVEGESVAREAEAIVLAMPAHAAAGLITPIDRELAQLLGGIEFAGVAVACLDYAAGAFTHVPAGFGFLVPRGEKIRMLGCLFVSSLFPAHAPEGRVSLRVLLGGAHDPGAIDEPEDRVLAAISDELALLLGARGAPRLLRLHRHRAAIAQYTLGHGRRLEAIERRLATLPGLHVAGSSYHGISIPDCIADAGRVAGSLLGE